MAPGGSPTRASSRRDRVPRRRVDAQGRPPSPGGGVPLRSADDPAEVVDRIARGDVYLRAITFREGLTIRQMAAMFEEKGFGPADAS